MNDSTLGGTSEPTPEQNKGLDELTRLTLRVIQLEAEIVRLDRKFKDWKELGYDGSNVDLLDKRIDILEEARQKQRELNATFAKGTEKPVEKKPLFKFWR